ncbi:MAG TPA: hypothetical protein VFS42_04335, partial [Burkholderiaceae bacterium]|nr:hypothetical protein [Burkholderiaceae bacterium]
MNSAWARPNSTRSALVYGTTNRGDRIADYSHAGYGGGGVALPNVSEVMRLNPSGGDDTARIQQALNDVSARSLQNGFRGALVLNPGRYLISSPLKISKSGVVLRGGGASPSDVTLYAPTPISQGFVMLQISGTTPVSSEAGATRTSISDAYVPSGAMSVNVTQPERFAVGDRVVVRRPISTEWVAFMEMDQLYRDGAHQTWLDPQSSSSVQRWFRTIKRIDGTRLTFDIPLTDSFDMALKIFGTVSKTTTNSGWIENSGAENLSFDSNAPRGTWAYQSNPDFLAVRLDYARDLWLRNIKTRNFTDNVVVGSDASRVTLFNLELAHDN